MLEDCAGAAKDRKVKAAAVAQKQKSETVRIFMEAIFNPCASLVRHPHRVKRKQPIFLKLITHIGV